ncbi:E3 ubiquitin-protein ligase RBBP6-like isoform X8 [Rhinoraja longicauda]
MSCIHYKFSSKLNYDTVTFDGLHISLSDLKKTIMAREKLKAADCDLQITNAQTKEEYTDDNALIPKNSSVIIKRIPIGGVKSAGKSFVIDRSEPASGTSKALVGFCGALKTIVNFICVLVTSRCFIHYVFYFVPVHHRNLLTC